MYGRFVLIAASLLLVVALAGCGGGGGSADSGGAGSGPTGDGAPAAGNTPAKAVTKITASGVLPDKIPAGDVMLTLSIPWGATIAVDPTSQEPVSGAVKLVSGADPVTITAIDGVTTSTTFQTVRYVPATATVPGSLSLAVFNLAEAGFGPLGYLTVELDITPGYTPVAKDFAVSGFKVGAVNAKNGDLVTVTDPVVSVAVQ